MDLFRQGQAPAQLVDLFVQAGGAHRLVIDPPGLLDLQRDLNDFVRGQTFGHSGVLSFSGGKI
jgi:hypothetical protein